MMVPHGMLASKSMVVWFHVAKTINLELEDFGSKHINQDAADSEANWDLSKKLLGHCRGKHDCVLYHPKSLPTRLIHIEMDANAENAHLRLCQYNMLLSTIEYCTLAGAKQQNTRDKTPET